jgi:hypothetical protein
MWRQVECRGCVGETVFHVCFLMGTPIHMHLAKRMLKVDSQWAYVEFVQAKMCHLFGTKIAKLYVSGLLSYKQIFQKSLKYFLKFLNQQDFFSTAAIVSESTLLLYLNRI